MGRQVNGPEITLTAGEDLVAFRRVNVSGSTVVYADANQIGIGVVQAAVDYSEDPSACIRLDNVGGTSKMMVSGMISAGAVVYPANDGKISATVNGVPLGYALEASTADGDIIEVLRTNIAGELALEDQIFGDVLSGGTPQGIYETDTTQNYALGTKRVTKYGEIFRYAKAGTYGVKSCFGAAFMNACVTSGAKSLNEALHVQAEIGDYTITMEQASVALNAFAGGYCTIGGGAAGTERHHIVSNTASAETTNHVVLTLEEPIRKQWTTSAWVECMVNPWSDLQCIVDHGDSYATFGGVPAVDADADDYFWCQTKGILWIVPGGGDTNGPGYEASERTVYFVGDGSINGAGAAIAIESGYQKAGEIVQLDSAGVAGPPYVRLQLE